MHHQNSDIESLNIHRNVEGRGLIRLENYYKIVTILL